MSGIAVLYRVDCTWKGTEPPLQPEVQAVGHVPSAASLRGLPPGYPVCASFWLESPRRQGSLTWGQAGGGKGNG